MAVLRPLAPAVLPLEANVVRGPRAWVVHVLGEVDLVTADALRVVVLDAVAQAPAVVVELGACPFADCAGLGALDDARRLARAHGVPFAVACRPHAPAAPVLAVATRFAVFASAGEALLDVGRTASRVR